MIIIGIDPGLSGAIAIIEDDNVKLFDMPTMSKGKTGNKKQLNLYVLYNILADFHKNDRIVVGLEAVNAFPGQGVTSMFSLGETFGGIQGVIAALAYEKHLIQPRAWKKYFKLSKDKEKSRAAAIELYPELSGQLSRKKDVDRAEALLIGRYTKEVLIK